MAQEGKEKVQFRANRLMDIDGAKFRPSANVGEVFHSELTLIEGRLRTLLEERQADLSPEARDRILLALRGSKRLLSIVEGAMLPPRMKFGDLTARNSRQRRAEKAGAGANIHAAESDDAREIEARIADQIRLGQVREGRLREGLAPDATVPGAPTRTCKDPAAAALYARIQAVVESHLEDEEFDSAALARGLGMSRATLYRRLGETLGHSAMALIRGLRIERAAALLRSGRESVSEIAYSVGFRSPSRFSACFRERFGVSPSEFRAGLPPGAPPEKMRRGRDRLRPPQKRLSSGGVS